MARGSTYKRNNSWGYRLDAGTDPESGKRRQVSRQGFRTKRAAEEALREAMNAGSRGDLLNQSRETLAEYLHDWLETREVDLKPSTLDSYRKAARRIERELGPTKIQKLAPMQVERFYAKLQASGGRGGKPLSPKTVNNTHTVLHKALEDAQRLGLVNRNAAASARTPRAPRRELTTWKFPEARSFIRHIEDHRLGAAYQLLLATGMRRGEALGLRWEWVDFDKRALSVVESLTQVSGKLVFTSPKTSNGRRLVYLDWVTLRRLEAHRRSQAEEQLASPIWEDERGLVFTDEIGRPVKPEWFSRQFTRLVSETGLPAIRLHDLRHTHATHALEVGMHPKAVSERLGHANIGVTLDLYSHVIPSVAAESADLVAARLYGEKLDLASDGQ